jgi:hypothetical protein
MKEGSKFFHRVSVGGNLKSEGKLEITKYKYYTKV